MDRLIRWLIVAALATCVVRGVEWDWENLDSFGIHLAVAVERQAGMEQDCRTEADE